MSDPVLVERARVANLVSKGIRGGTALFVVASVVFFIGFMTGFTNTMVYIIVGLMIIGSVFLAPAMVFHYGVKAANRADRNDDW